MNSYYNFDSSSDDFYLDYTQKPIEERNVNEHLHAAWELYFYLGDNMTYFINDTTYNVKKYDLVFVDRHKYHKTRYKSDEEKNRILILLRGGFFSLFADKKPIYDYLLTISQYGVLSFDEDAQKIVCEKFLNLAKFYETNSEDKAKLQIFMAEILASVVNFIETKRVRTGTKNKSKNSIIVSQITNYINIHYSEKITLDFLAEKFFIDKFHMCHIFRKETGVTIVDFINQKRIAEASILLKSSQKSICDISSQVGFLNQNYFGVMFKKQYGKSPREFRLDE